MGKKQNQSQRTKGNLQASSSSRAAQLLQSKNASITPTLGFSKDISSEGGPSVDSILSSSFRKLGKKEAVTKQKALGEILEAVSVENVEGCLVLWARSFSRISIDNERKIRELSQEVHSKIVNLAGRNFAPYLNNVMGPWLESTCDIHSATAQLASTSLNTAFPGDKLPNAITFCEKGINKHLKDRLESSPSTLSDMKITDPVDAEEKYSRVIGSSLRMLVLLLRKTEKLESINSLLLDNILWVLGRSKVMQVRKHLYNFISDVSRLPGDTGLPDVAYKTITQQLNACNRDTTQAQYAALEALIGANPDRFWSTVSVGDVRGQLLDAIKSKALSGGVLQPVLLHMAGIVKAFYQYWLQEGTNSAWYADVLSNTSKCLSQCKLLQDKLTTLLFLETISLSIKTTWGDDIPNISTICAILSTLTTNSLSFEILQPLETILNHLPRETKSSDVATPDPITSSILLSIKQNESEVTNTLVIAKVLLAVRAESKEVILSRLVARCVEQMGSGNFVFVSRILEEVDELSEILFAKLTHDDTSDLSLINLTNSTLIPHFSNSAYTYEQISELSKVVIKLLPHGNTSYQNIVQTLVTHSLHRNVAFLTFLKEQVASPSNQLFISAKFMCETFDSLENELSQETEDIVSNLAVLSSTVSALNEHFTDNIRSALVSSHELSPKLVTLLKHMNWKADNIDTITLILENMITSENLAIYTPVLTKIVEQGLQYSAQIIEKILDIDEITVDDVEKCLSQVFKTNISPVLKYCSDRLSVPPISNSSLVELFEESGVLTLSESCYGAAWSDKDVLLLKSAVQFLCQASFGQDTSENTHLSHLIVLDFLVNKPIKSLLVDKIILNAPEDLNVIISEIVNNHGMLVTYLLSSLLSYDFEIIWSDIDGISSLPLESLVILSEKFGFNPTDIILKTEDELIKNVSYIAHLAVTSDSVSITKMVDVVAESYLADIDTVPLKELPAIYKLFLNVFLSDSATDEHIEFILCSTATVMQATLDIITTDFSLEQQFFLSAALLSFNRLYNSLKSGIQTNEKYSQFSEDWELFFEPGIQDLVLLLHDKMLSFSLHESAGYLSSIILLAPSNSVKSFMKRVLKCNDDISFNQCLHYIMGCYQTGGYETQTALFSILLQSQQLFDLKTEESCEVVEMEDAQFDSPPKIFMDCLSKIDLVNFENTSEYENRLLKATHIWILLLVSESTAPAHVIREHVEFLRSKHILSDFLDNLVYLIRFSARKYDIIPMESIMECSSFESHQLASTCFMGIATVFPALLRNWWKRLDKEMTISVDKFVKAFISPTLIKVETNVQADAEDDTLLIRPRPVVREVVATYTMDDITADLIINIAINHPLTPPTVSCERQVGVPVSTWRSWMLQMTSMFQNQNSSIVSALEHWRKNMDKQFEGLESCMICFSVVQGPKKALPKPTCKTCKKRFHSACLYKWFSTSGKSTCPMCRSVFQHATGLRARLQEAPEHE